MNTVETHDPVDVLEPGAERDLAMMALGHALTGMNPPERLLVPLAILEPEKSFRFAAIASAGSLAGTAVAYALGYLVFVLIGQRVVDMQGWQPMLVAASEWAGRFDVAFVLAGGFSPLPFNIFGLACGFFGTSLLQLLVAAAVARSARMTLVAWLIWRGGPRFKEWIERNLYGMTMALAVGIMLVGVLVQYLMGRFAGQLVM